MKLKFFLALALVLNLSTPIASSQAANVLNFSANESFNLTFPEGSYYISGRQVPFKKGDQPSVAYLNSEMEHICGESYASPKLSVRTADGNLSSYKLLSAKSVLKTKWIIASNGKNSFSVNAACKQRGIFSIPISDGYQFNLKFKKDPREPELPSSPWYSKNYLSDNQWKVNYSNNSREWVDQMSLRLKWLPKTELPLMPTIRVERIHYGPNDVNHLSPLASLAITSGSFNSPTTGGWNKWTLEINDGIGTVFRRYTDELTFDWPLNVSQDDFRTHIFEIRVMQAGYRYSSLAGRFVIPSVGETVQFSDVHRTPEGEQVDPYCDRGC